MIRRRVHRHRRGPLYIVRVEGARSTGWQVRRYLRRKPHGQQVPYRSAYFADKKHGGPVKAFLAAQKRLQQERTR